MQKKMMSLGKSRDGYGWMPGLLEFVLVLGMFAATLAVTTYAAPSYAEETQPSPDLPASLLYLNEQEASYAFLVDKSEQRLYLYKWEGDGPRLVKSFVCSTGQNPGGKIRRGDKRTPDGVYFFTRVIESNKLASVYGIRAYPTDYPNFLDRLSDKNGDGIWLHGTDQALSFNKTKGCIVLENRDLAELSSYIRLRRTPIIIEEKVSKSFPDDLKKQGDLIRAILDEWRQSWEAKEIDRYMSFYSKKFRSDKKDWQAWRDYKERLNRQYRDISVKISDPIIIVDGRNTLVVFYQAYRSDLFSNEGTKRLYFNPDLKIIGEEWDVHKNGEAPPPIPDKIMQAFFKTKPVKVAAPIKVATAPPAIMREEKPSQMYEENSEAPTPSKLEILNAPEAIAAVSPSVRAAGIKPVQESGSEIAAIRDFLEIWRRAWETKDIDTYMNCYSRDFQAKGKDWEKWRQYKQSLNKVYNTIHIVLQNVKVSKTDRGMLVSFYQDYRSDVITSLGMKNLQVKQESSGWKIVQERFLTPRK